jgi:hypothetical protein
MKTLKTFLATACLCGLVAADLRAQARVNFQATSTTPLLITDGLITSGGFTTPGTITQILGTASTATFGIGPASVRVELLAGPTLELLAPVLIGINADAPYVTNYSGTVASFQGGFSGGAVLPLPGVDGSAPLIFQYRAWSIGPDNALSFADRLFSGSGFAGASELISVTPTTGVLLPAPLLGPGPDQWQSLTLYTVVPEPATLALLGLGLGLAIGLRRSR